MAEADERDELLESIADLCAQRGFSRDHEFNETLITCIATKLARAGYGRHTDVL